MMVRHSVQFKAEQVDAIEELAFAWNCSFNEAVRRLIDIALEKGVS